MQKLIALITLMLSSALFSQFPWSVPQLVCDSTGDNRNPAFVRAEPDYGLDYNVLLWERDYGDRSRIFLKNFADPDSEIAITPDVPGLYARHPAGFSYWWIIGDGVLIVWQSNPDGNFDLFSTLYQDGQFKALRQITTDPTDDIQPDVFENFLTWEREGKIYRSEYSYSDSTWSAEILIDSARCSHPAIGYRGIVYEKQDTTGSAMIYFTNGIQPPQCICIEGDNRFPVWENDYSGGLLWQNKTGSDWNIISSFSWDLEDTSMFIFSPADEVHPRGLEIPIYTNQSTFEGPMYLAFQSNPGGDEEIYTHDSWWDYPNIYNLSQHPGEDRNPVFSEMGWEEAPQSNSVRCWLAWESYRNGRWQIRGSYQDIIIDGIEDPAGQIWAFSFRLFQNYPNPFNPETAISYQLSAFSDVELAVYNLLGQKVRTLVQARQPAGRYEVKWDGRDEAEREVSSGVYIYRLRVSTPSERAGDFVQSRKMLLIR